MIIWVILLTLLASSLSTADDCFDEEYLATTEPGRITSPNYPNNYTNSATCVTTIYASGSQIIQLNFEEFHVELYQGCTYDYLEVRDGSTSTSPLLGRFCGSSSPGTITSSGNSMRIEFSTDNTVNKTGFLANFRTFDPNGLGVVSGITYGSGISSDFITFDDDNRIIIFIDAIIGDLSYVAWWGWIFLYTNSSDGSYTNKIYLEYGENVDYNGNLISGVSDSSRISIYTAAGEQVCEDRTVFDAGLPAVMYIANDPSTIASDYVYLSTCQTEWSDIIAANTFTKIQLYVNVDFIDSTSSWGASDYLSISYWPVAKCNQPTITNGSVTPATATVEQGDTYEASCDSGFTLSGWATMTCQSNGTFGQIPTCEAIIVECNQPTITNGSVTPANATVEQGDTYEASCDSGFTLSGWATMTCQSNGTFDEIPTCEVDDDEDNSDNESGSIKDDDADWCDYDTEVMAYRCYYSGSPTTTCLALAVPVMSAISLLLF